MTPRERLIVALNGDMPDQIPFSCYETVIPSDTVRRRLNNLGMSVVERIEPFRTRRQKVVVERINFHDGKYPAVLTTFKTPIGNLNQKQIIEPGYGSLWTREYLIKKPEDYEVFEFILRDEVYEEDIDTFIKKDESYGQNGLALPRAADPPSQFLWRRFTGLERFALDWFDCRDEVMRVINALAERNEKIWKIAARTPGGFCASGGNLSGDTVGPPMFAELIQPHFAREAEIMQTAGKRTINHMDGMMKSLIESVAACPIDVIEAFNPEPDGNVSVREARNAWAEKTLSINFPSSVHLSSMEKIKEMVIEILRQAIPGRGFVIGVTEDVPSNVVQESLATIATTLNEHGRCPLHEKDLQE